MFSPEFLAVGGGSTRYRINQSLRFRASNSARLSRTGLTSVTANRHVVSFWAKLGAGSNQALFCGYSNGNNYTYCGTSPSNQLNFTVVGGGSTQVQFITNAVYRDPTAWYHVAIVVDTTLSTASDRYQIWVNGSRVTSFATSTNTLAQNSGMYWGDNFTQYIGTFDTVTNYFDGYLAEFIFTGQMTTNPGVGAFGQINPATNQWVPRRYTGTYGTNGFYLPFNDAASTTTISQDRSGNGNNWTSSGISVTAGATFDQMLDSPTNNYCTWSPLKQSGSGIATLSAANLRLNGGSGESAIGTQGMSSGKWYWEVVYSTLGTTPDVGIIQLPGNMSSYPAGQKHYVYSSDGNKRSDGPGPVAYGASWTSGDVIGVAFDADAGSITFYKNNVSQGVAFSGISSSEYPFFPCASVSTSTGDVNFGQRAFAYTPPTDFAALNTANIPTPTIQRGDDGMQATLRTGTGASASVSSLRFQPDLVWIKSRSNATNHNLFDAVRGVNNGLVSNSTAAEYADANSLTAFNSNGYSLGTDGSSRGVNINTNTYVDWAWREGAAYGFDIVTYTGNGVNNRDIAHSLNAIPHFGIVKRRNADGGRRWMVKHRSQAASNNLVLDGTDAQFNPTAAAFGGLADFSSSSTFRVVAGVTDISAVNGNTDTYVTYLWTSIPGFSLFGSYTGNGSVDGPFVWCGFRPRFIMIKNVIGATSWAIYDTAINPTNQVGPRLIPNLPNAEATDGVLDITANGFKLRENNANINGGSTNYIFAAFAEHPFKFANAR